VDAEDAEREHPRRQQAEHGDLRQQARLVADLGALALVVPRRLGARARVGGQVQRVVRVLAPAQAELPTREPVQQHARDDDEHHVRQGDQHREQQRDRLERPYAEQRQRAGRR
jgi:hypothetical protein